MIINIRRKSFIAKLYFWSIDVWRRFTDTDFGYYGDPDYSKIKETNLCALTKSLPLCALAILAQVITYGTLIFVVVVAPIFLFGMVGYGFFWFYIGLFIFSVFILWFLCKAIVQKRNRSRKLKVLGPIDQNVGSVGFRKLLLVWLKAKKEKICLPVVFIDDEVKNENA